MQSIQRLGEEHFGQILTLMTSVYGEDPVYQRLLNQQSDGFTQRLRATLRELIVRHLAEGDPIFGQVDETGHVHAAACVTSQSLKSEISGSWVWRLKMLTTAGIGATSEFLQFINEIDAYVPSSPHRMLTLFASERQTPYEDLGDKLLRSILDFCDEDEESSGLYTVQTQANRAIFEPLQPLTIHHLRHKEQVADIIKFITDPY